MSIKKDLPRRVMSITIGQIYPIKSSYLPDKVFSAAFNNCRDQAGNYQLKLVEVKQTEGIFSDSSGKNRLFNIILPLECCF